MNTDIIHRNLMTWMISTYTTEEFREFKLFWTLFNIWISIPKLNMGLAVWNIHQYRYLDVREFKLTMWLWKLKISINWRQRLFSNVILWGNTFISGYKIKDFKLDLLYLEQVSTNQMFMNLTELWISKL